MKQTKQVELPEVQKVEAMIVKLQDEYGLHQGDKANLTGREEDAADQTPVIFTRRDTLSLARMAEIIVLESAQAQQEAVERERERIIVELKRVANIGVDASCELKTVTIPSLEALQKEEK